MCDAMVVDLIVNAVLICYKGVVKQWLDTSKKPLEHTIPVHVVSNMLWSYVIAQMRIIYISGE